MELELDTHQREYHLIGLCLLAVLGFFIELRAQAVAPNSNGTAVSDLADATGLWPTQVSNAAQITDSAPNDNSLNSNSDSGPVLQTGVSCVPAPSGLIAWWPGEGNANDIVGGNNGTIANGAGFIAGKIGQAFSFNGSNQAVVIPYSSNLFCTNFSVETWVKPAGQVVEPVINQKLIFGQGYGFVQLVVRTGTVGIRPVFQFGINRSTFYEVDPTIEIPIGQWSHVVGTWDGTTLRLYINGALNAQSVPGTVPVSSGCPFQIGGFYTPFAGSCQSVSQFFNGAIDEVSFYNRALAAAEVLMLYNAGSAGKCAPPGCVSPPSGLVGWWRGEDNALDSALTNHGIPQGITYSNGEVGQTFSFSGSGSSYVRIPASQSIDVGQSNGFTLELWCNPASTNATVVTVAEWNNSSGALTGIGCHLEFYSAGRILGDIVDPTTGNDHYLESSGGDVTPNVWTHVAMTYDKTTGNMILYTNGVILTNGNVGVWRPSTSFDLYFGIRTGGPFAPIPYQGLLDEISLYDRVLSPSEILGIYKADGAGKCHPSGIAPVITTQPASLSVMLGSNATFSVTAQGTAPLSYQWFFSSNSLAGKTNSTLTLTNVQPTQQGNYSVIVTNTFGKAVSSNAFLTVLPPPVCVPPPSGIVAWWRAESNTVDSIGVNDALPQAPQSPLIPYTPGKVGTAFNFTGTTYLQVPASDDLNVGPGAGFTVEGWVRPNSTAATQPLLEWSEGRNVGVGLFLNFSNAPGSIAAHFTDTNSTFPPFPLLRRSVLRSANFVISNLVWQHVALTFDRASGLATIYVNGHSVAQTNLVSFTPLTQTPVYMGYGPVLNPPLPPFLGTRFTGAMDEFSIYNRALSATEIQSIVGADTTGKCPPPPPSCTPAPAGIVSWWRGQSNALDSVDRNNGLISNAVTYTPGQVGAGFQFSGGYIRVPASSNLNVGAGPELTVELWVKPSLWEAQPFVEWNNGTGTQGVYIAYGPGVGVLQAGLVDTNGVSHLLNSPLDFVGYAAWEHLALTYDKSSGVAALYYEGYQVASSNFGSFTPRTSYDLYLGYRPGSGMRFTGTMDEVSVYNRALSSTEIRVVIAARNSGKCAEAPFIITQPMSQRVTENFSATFSVVAGGTPNLHYQWRFGSNAVPNPGATSNSFTVFSVQPSNAGPYSVQITNAFGSVISSNAILTLNFPPVPFITVSPVASFPGNTNLFVIAACGPKALVAFDGSKSYDPDDPTFSYSWFEGTNLFSTNVVATNLLALGTHRITLFVDDHVPGGTNSAAVTVQVISLAEAVELVIDFLNSSGFPQLQPLVVSLKAAADSFTRGNTTSGANQLGAFQNKVQPQVAPANPALAASLIQATQEILDALARCDSSDVPHGKLVALPRHENGKLHIKLTGKSAGVLLVEASTNLVNWAVVGTPIQNADGTYDFEDSNAVNLPNRFYRIVPLQGP